MREPSRRIAIVGLACRYPGAASPEELWDNVLAGRRAFRRMPPERLRLEDYRPGAAPPPDSLDCTEAAVLDGWEFDRVAFRVAGAAYRVTDPAHWLALDVAARALDAAGFPSGRDLPRDRVGVLVGNSLTGETSRAQLLRLRWPYVRRVVAAALDAEGWSDERRDGFLATLEEGYKAPFEPPGEETLAGGLSNTIAGRICNHFDLGGGGYTVDGACASSLLAVANACSALVAEDLDVALAGGVDLSLDPFELVGFSRTGALSSGEMWVYDRRSQGFLPGEGCGLAVLMRLDDALAQKRPILATIAGWGVSSDGAGGVTRPAAEGQLRALRAAYRRAGFGPETVGCFEGHGTGTAVGDATELDALDRLVREAGGPPPEPIAVGSVKAVIGHTKAAAGIAGLIKAVAAARAGVIPATVGCGQPHPRFASNGRGRAALRPASRAEVWRRAPRRAGVSAMGFGGINCHVVIEAHEDTAARRPSGAPLKGHEELLDRSRQDAELLLLAAEEPAALAERLAETAGRVRELSRAELTDLAAELAAGRPAGACRCAVVASRPAEAADALHRAAAALDGPPEGVARGDGFWVGRLDRRGPREGSGRPGGSDAGPARDPVVGLLFTGQGSARPAGGDDWIRRFPEAEVLHRRADALRAAGPQSPSSGAGGPDPVQLRVVTASLMAVALLDRLGIRPRVAVGHSLGELAALWWGGALDSEAVMRLALARSEAMASLGGPPGAMASLSCSPPEALALVRGTPVVVAAHNGPDRVAISGPAPTVRERIAEARRRGIAASPLPVAHAFHSPAMEGAAAALEEAARRERPAPRTPGRIVVSTVTGRLLDPELDLPALLRRQLTAPVLFDQAMEEAERAAGGVDLWIEAGPGRALAELAARRGGAPAAGMEAGGAGLNGLLQVAGALFCTGAAVDPAALFRDRFTRPLSRERRVLGNPCERAPAAPAGGLPRPSSGPPEVAFSADPAPALPPPPDGADTHSDTDPVDVVRALVAARTELPAETLGDGDRMLSDLHLNSISVGQVVVEAARRLGVTPPGAPTDFADASVAEIGAALRELGSGEPPPEEPFPEGVAPWVRELVVELVERPAPEPGAAGPAAPSPRILGPDRLAGLGRLRELLETGVPHRGTLVWLPPELDDQGLSALLEAIPPALDHQGTPEPFILVHSGIGGAFARSLHLERRRGETLVVQVPAGSPQAAEWVATEVRAGGDGGYREAVYDARGTRRVPVLRPYHLDPRDGRRGMPLGAEDVVLITGGGRGIATECALALARRTGCALALVGRSQPEGSDELARNLERLAEAGVRHAYRAADVTDPRATRAAVAALEEALGSVTAVLHAAGVNRPRPLARLDLEALRETLDPKVRGLGHVLEALDPERLRLLVGFGSIIARTGMPGEAHYGLANEALAQAVEAFGRRHRACRCLTLEWSVWSGVGMGERLAGAETMRRRGITPIPPDRGVERLLALLEAPSGPGPTVVVTGRFGDPRTVDAGPPELPFARFLERPAFHLPAVELVVEAELSPDDDPYLEDHVFAGERLLPAVLGLEAMAQAARALHPEGGTHGDPEGDPGGGRRTVFEGVELRRPVVVPADGRTTVRICALREATGSCRLALRSSETGFRVDHFRGRCTFEAAAADGDATGLPGPWRLDREPLDLDPATALYGSILFHRGRFRRLRWYRRLTARECAAEIAPHGAAAGWFARHLPPRLLLGDPGARDAALHAVQASIPHVTVLPLGVERLEIGVLDPEETHHVEAREIGAEPGRLIYDLVVRRGDGRVVERWQGLALALVGDAPAPEAWPPALVGPLLERRAEELTGQRSGAVSLRRTVGPAAPGTAERRGAGDRALADLLGPGAGGASRRPDGKPETEDGRRVSLAYAPGATGTLVLATAGLTAGEGGAGCDLETVTARDPGVWRDLLGSARWELARAVARAAGEAADHAASRVWAAGEALAKAGVPADAPLVLEELRGPWVALRSGELAVATGIVAIAGEERPIALALVCLSQDGEPAEPRRRGPASEEVEAQEGRPAAPSAPGTSGPSPRARPWLR